VNANAVLNDCLYDRELFNNFYILTRLSVLSLDSLYAVISPSF